MVLAETPTRHFMDVTIVEVKGDADGVTFDGNTAKFNSGGIQFGMKGIRPIHLPTQPSQTTYSQIS